MSVFQNINGRSGEDIATEVVAYMPSSPRANVPFQKLFFWRILGKPEASAEMHVEIRIQPSFKFGRPDFVIMTSNAVIAVETKLGSYLSGDDQLMRYCRLFDDLSILQSYFPLVGSLTGTSKVLVLLAPRSTIERSIDATNRVCQGQSFSQWLSTKGIVFVGLPWEEVVTDLDTADSLQNELRLFVEQYINQELTEDEKMILKNVAVPVALNKLFEHIAEMRSILLTKGFKGGRMSQSYNYYGFSIECEDLSLWFGYFLRLWQHHGTPVFLQVRQSWIKNRKTDILTHLKAKSFLEDPNEEFVRPFVMDQIESWKDALNDLLVELYGTKEDRTIS